MMGLRASCSQQGIAEGVVRHLAQVTPSYATGALVVHNRRGQAVLYRCHPVDDLFLQAVQRRLLLSYQLCVGPALSEPELQVTIYGDAVSGPCELPRSMLTMPILSGGRVTGMIVTASVFPDAYTGTDLCTMSVLAAQTSEALEQARADGGKGVPVHFGVGLSPLGRGAAHLSTTSERETPLLQGPLRSQVGHYVRAILDLAETWQDQGNGDLTNVLRRDLDTIAQNALHIWELVTD
jgi:hypothetical protein